MGRNTFRPLGVIALGDCAAYVEFSRTLDLEVNAFVQRLGSAVEQALKKQAAHDVLDIVPTFGGLALHFDPGFEGDILQATADLVEKCIDDGLPAAGDAGHIVEVPVCYEAPFAIDLDEVCEKTKLSKDRLVHLHVTGEYRVLMMGFAPGHAYVGGLDPQLSIPRRANPRAAVPAGSVAIANEQTVIYPYAISGGWSVIGRTPLTVFDAARAEPSLFLAGDRVRFRAIDAQKFLRLSGKK